MSPPSPLLQVDDLSKSFCRNTRRALRYGVADILREILPGTPRPRELRADEFWSLDGVEFTLRRGEALAIGGRNGAGKTTLLRILAGLLKPDRGGVRVAGAINSVIELGQGLNPQLTGRENANLGLAWRGVPSRGIAALVDRIEDFAKLGEMFDSPVNSYSAGMRVRLAFAIAIAVPCDLLILDEVLAVGDLAFQRKCIEHMRRHLHDGGALILVSHNPVQMQALCRRGILLERGRLAFDGPIEDCIDRMFALQDAELPNLAPATEQEGETRVHSVNLLTGATPTTGEPFGFETTFTLAQPANILCSATIWTRDLSTCITSINEPDGTLLQPGTYTKRCHVAALPLAHGTYAMRVSVVDADAMMPLAHQGFDSPVIELRVEEPISRISVLSRHIGQLVVLDSTWVDMPGLGAAPCPIPVTEVTAS